jgi:acetyl-CoA carboxylase biotin carboxyl carrier protein
VTAVRAPSIGRVVELLVAVGDVVREGQEVAVIESMKMEIPVVAERDGTVNEIAVAVGATVRAGAVLLVVAP